MVSGQQNEKAEKLQSQFPFLRVVRGDLTDFASLLDLLSKEKPQEIYNLGAISHVGLSFRQPELTANTTGLGALRLLEAIRLLNLDDVKFYQASSSEMFGQVREIPQNELTAFHPRSPYGVAKTFAHHTTVHFREAYGIFASSGILFNHESEYRGFEFVTRKITSNLAKVKLGQIQKFKLGSLEPKRDWGYAGDYVEAMWKMLNHYEASDFVIATGESHSVLDFLLVAMDKLGLGNDVDKYVEFDSNLIRPSEVDFLIGDASKARVELNWRPTTSFDQMIEIMVENDLRLANKV
jgi:GDPmannose 4,6-dehydratase